MQLVLNELIKFLKTFFFFVVFFCSKGSVVAEIVLLFACKASATDAQLLVNLQAVILMGKVGPFQVEKTNILGKYTTGNTNHINEQANKQDVSKPGNE